MNRTERLFAVREALRAAGKWGRTAEWLSAEFGVSERTIKRDVAALQQSGLPVWTRTGPGGGYVLRGDMTLPPVNFTGSEIVGLAAAAKFYHQQPFGHDLRAALCKALAVMDKDIRRRVGSAAERVWVDTATHADVVVVDPLILRAVEQALMERWVLSMTYCSAGGRNTQRRVDTICLISAQGAWYLGAFCRERHGLRWFRVDRIISAKLTKDTSNEYPVSVLGEPPTGAVPLGPFD